ncbi:MAG: metal-sensing transcriptional repressor [Patescibacteria group bacterium]
MPKGIPKDNSLKHSLLHRLKIARGHLNQVIEMVTNDEYCIDIIHQSQAVQAALKGVDDSILKNHMETCMAEEIKKGNSKQIIAEVMKIVKKQ